MKIKTLTLKSSAVALCLLGTIPSLEAQVNYAWAKNVGGGGLEYCYAVSSDKSGNVYSTGYFQGTADLDPGTGTSNFTSVGAQDVFVIKVDVAGNFVWARQIGGAGNDQGYAITTDTGGNIYAAGYFSGTVDFDPGTGTSNMTAVNGADVFICKLDPSGNFIWAKQMGGPGFDQPVSVIVDTPGNIYTAGYFQSTADFDPGAGVSPLVSGGGFDAFISKLDASGNFVWAKRLGGNGYDFCNGMAVDAAGNVYTTGIFQNTADFDPGTGTANLIGMGGYDAFICKLNASGDYVWAKQAGNINNDYGTGVGVDAAGNVYATGHFETTVDFDPGAGTVNLTSNGAADIYVLKLDAAGNYVWVRQIGGPDADYGNALMMDAVGNPCFLGYFNNTVDFDPGTGTSTLSSAGADDIYAAKLSGAGNYMWAKKLGGPGNDYGFCLSTDRSGNVYTGGMFNGVADFDPGAGTSTLNSDNGGHAFFQKMICYDTSSTILTQTACDSFVLNGITYKTSGQHVQRRPNAAGCDSIIRLNLTLTPVNVVISYTQPTLSTNGTYTTYQWFRNGTLISGATSSTYTATQNGAYTVAVTNASGCKDTSDVYNVTDASGIDDPRTGLTLIYPNPSSGKVFVESPIAVDIALCGIDGKIILRAEKARELDIRSVAPGVYFLRISDSRNGNLLQVEKLVRNP